MAGFEFDRYPMGAGVGVLPSTGTATAKQKRKRRRRTQKSPAAVSKPAVPVPVSKPIVRGSRVMDEDSIMAQHRQNLDQITGTGLDWYRKATAMGEAIRPRLDDAIARRLAQERENQVASALQRRVGGKAALDRLYKEAGPESYSRAGQRRLTERTQDWMYERGLDRTPEPIIRGTSGMVQHAPGIPPWLQRRIAEKRQLDADNAGWARSRDTAPMVVPTTEVNAPGTLSLSDANTPIDTGALFKRRADAAVGTDEWQGHLAKSKQYVADRKAGNDAARPGALYSRSPTIYPTQMVIDTYGDGQTKNYEQYKSELDARRADSYANRRAGTAKKTRKQMVSQKARGEQIDPEMALARVLMMRQAEGGAAGMPEFLQSRMEQNRLERMDPGMRQDWLRDRAAREQNAAAMRQADATMTAAEADKARNDLSIKSGRASVIQSQIGVLTDRLANMPEEDQDSVEAGTLKTQIDTLNKELGSVWQDIGGVPPSLGGRGGAGGQEVGNGQEITSISQLPDTYRGPISSLIGSTGKGPEMRKLIIQARINGFNISPSMADKLVSDTENDEDATFDYPSGELIPGTGEVDRFIQKVIPFWPAFKQTGSY